MQKKIRAVYMRGGTSKALFFHDNHLPKMAFVSKAQTYETVTGIIDIGAKVEKKGDTYAYEEAIVGRTARRLMEGYVCVPERFFI